MNAVWFIFVVAVLNTGLGFAIAVHLGRRYRAVVGAESEWDFGEWDDVSESAGGEESVEPEDEATKPAPSTSHAEIEDECRSEGGVVPDAPASTTPCPSAGDAAVEAFLVEVEQYHEQLEQADGELRCQADNPDADSVRACLQSLLEASREYAEQRERARTELDSAWGERPEFGIVCEQLDGAVVAQDKQIDSTERAIGAFPYTGELAAGCRVMTDETTRLMDANILVRDALHEAGIAAAREEGRLADLEARKRPDALTGAESRAALESTLLEWMDKSARRTETPTLAAIDVDEFGRINREFGHAVGNELLHALGQVLVAENRGQVRLARFNGARFALLFPDSTLRDTTNAVERLRQTVEQACFDYETQEIRITVSCGVAGAAPDDTPATLIARAEATLMEAKRYGRNRTFIHEGKYPTPVVPPKFSIEQRWVTL